MAKELKDFYGDRKGTYVKSETNENFLYDMNKILQEKELKEYRDLTIQDPFIFVFGLPRSGTTLVTQLIAHSFDLGYINNFVARFWLSPLHGIRLYRIIYGDHKETSFRSDYARTSELGDIHEFGYFWRYWLKKESIEGVTMAREREDDIDWDAVYRVLANLQHEFQKPMIFKNIFGSYHLERMQQTLGRTIYVYIERDPLDVAISILDARRKYYSDLNTWWSYMPVEYDRIKNLDYWKQIAGQIYYLKRFYDKEVSRLSLNNVVKVTYMEMAHEPAGVLERIDRKSRELYNRPLDIVNQPPESFPFRTYTERSEEKERFKHFIAGFDK